MRQACLGVGGGILKNALLMDHRLNAHTAEILNVGEIFIDIVAMNAQPALVDQVAGVSDLSTAEIIERLC